MKTRNYVTQLLLAFGLCAAIILADGLAGPPGPAFDLSWNTSDSGGGASAGAAFELAGTIGQPEAGALLAGGAFTIDGGFWPGAAPPLPPCPADLAPPGGNQIVNVSDLLVLISEWGLCPTSEPCPADIAPARGNGVVNVGDLLALIAEWGPC